MSLIVICFAYLRIFSTFPVPLSLFFPPQQRRNTSGLARPRTLQLLEKSSNKALLELYKAKKTTKHRRVRFIVVLSMILATI